jgi:hypothetical protein
MRRTVPALVAATAAVCLAIAGCTDSTSANAPAQAQQQEQGQPVVFTHAEPDAPATVLPAEDDAQAAALAAQALFTTAPVAVVAPAADVPTQVRAASAAVALGAPLLVGAEDQLTDELKRLDTEAVLAFGDTEDIPDVDVIRAPDDDTALTRLLKKDLNPAPEPLTDHTAITAVAALDRDRPTLLHTAPATATATGATPTTGVSSSNSEENEDADTQLPQTRAAEPVAGVVVLSSGAVSDLPADATARAAGAVVHVVPGGDPRASVPTIEALSKNGDAKVIALGSPFGNDQRLGSRLAVVRTGVQLPGGGQTLFPGRRMVALYGHPGTASLGVLGEQPVEEAIERAKKTAAQYEPLSDRPVVPTFEIIATIASGAAGKDGDYSAEADIEHLRPWVDAAREAGVYVLLDLQPGTTDFLSQAKRYSELLEQPHVGLALDPEWRLKPGQRHMRQIGSVDVAEVNATAAWLAELTRKKNLPQKLFVVHQFRLSMISGREKLETGHDELAVMIHADGNGTPGEKLATWRAVRANAPAGVSWGWKNFYDEDRPTFSPKQTYEVEPVPDLVTYQ